MPYKDKSKASAAVMRHYYANKEAYLERNRRTRRAKAAYIQKLKDVPCTDCGGTFPRYVLQFDHKGDKLYNISQMSNLGWSTIDKEVAKCDVVCANCHVTRTHFRSVGETANAVGLNPTVL